jgi:ketosteroid isomerase-like protein
MSSSALAPVQAWYDAISERDWETLRAIVDPDIEFIVADGFPAGGRYIGPAAVFDDFFPASFTAWTVLKPAVDEIFAVDDAKVVVRGRYVGQTKETGTPFDVPFAHLWRTRDGKLTWLQQYIDTALIRDAIAGIPAGSGAAELPGRPADDPGHIGQGPGRQRRQRGAVKQHVGPSVVVTRRVLVDCFIYRGLVACSGRHTSLRPDRDQSVTSRLERALCILTGFRASRLSGGSRSICPLMPTTCRTSGMAASAAATSSRRRWGTWMVMWAVSG